MQAAAPAVSCGGRGGGPFAGGCFLLEHPDTARRLITLPLRSRKFELSDVGVLLQPAAVFERQDIWVRGWRCLFDQGCVQQTERG